MVVQALEAVKEQTAARANKGKKGTRGCLDQMELQGQMGLKVHKDLRVKEVLEGETREHPVPRVTREIREKKLLYHLHQLVRYCIFVQNSFALLKYLSTILLMNWYFFVAMNITSANKGDKKIYLVSCLAACRDVRISLEVADGDADLYAR